MLYEVITGTFMGLTALGLMTASFGLGQMIGPAFAGYAYELAGSLLPASLPASAIARSPASGMTPPVGLCG